MPDQTIKLGMPLILPSQAQKHVTHNEALSILDNVVQLVLSAIDIQDPPAAPQESDAYAIADGASGDWQSQDGKIAVWQNGAWSFLVPREGWCAWDLASQRLTVFSGGNWEGVTGSSQNLEGLGINASYDMTNRLAVSADATLLTNDGNGHQLKVNKAAATDTASL